MAFGGSKKSGENNDIGAVQRELALLRRAYNLISECNERLIGAQDEGQLMQDICDIIVRTGGYRLVWVGFPLKDEKKTVQPIAQAGFEKGYLETLNVSWAETERGRGPTGTAIREQKVIIAQNIQKNPEFAPWREQALKRGYQSSIALPLMHDEYLVGALNVYSDKPDAFDPEEVAVLEELANDLAFGIIILRRRKREKEAEQAIARAEANFSAIVEQSLAGLYVIQEGKFTFVNPFFVKIFGYDSVEEIVALPSVNRLIHPDDVNLVQRNIQRRLAGEVKSLQYGFRGLRKDGRIIQVEVHGGLGTFNGKPAIIGAIVDITQRTETERQRAQFEAIIESTTDFISIAETDETIAFINRGGRRLAGLRDDDDISMMNINEFHPEWAYKKVREEGIPTALRDGIWVGGSALLHLPTRREIPVSQVIIARKNHQGEITLLATLCRDISDAVRIEQELRGRTDEMERLNKLMIGRELKMVKLKEEIEELKRRAA